MMANANDQTAEPRPEAEAMPATSFPPRSAIPTPFPNHLSIGDSAGFGIFQRLIGPGLNLRSTPGKFMLWSMPRVSFGKEAACGIYPYMNYIITAAIALARYYVGLLIFKALSGQ
jgi:hypothetical protein